MRKALEAAVLVGVGELARLWGAMPPALQQAALIFVPLLVIDLLVTRWYSGVFGRVRGHGLDVVRASQARAVTNLLVVATGAWLDLVKAWPGTATMVTLAWGYWDHFGWTIGQIVRIRQHYRQHTPQPVVLVAAICCPELKVTSRVRRTDHHGEWGQPPVA